MNKGTGLLAAALAVVVVAGGFYIVQLNSTIATAQNDLAAANKTSQQCAANLDGAQKNVASVTSARDALQTQLTEANAKVDTIPALTTERDAAQKELAGIKARIAADNKLTGYWRDLFDYTKPAPPAPY